MEYQSETLFDPRDSIHSTLAVADFQQADRLLDEGYSEDQVMQTMRGWAMDIEHEAHCADIIEREHFYLVD